MPISETALSSQALMSGKRVAPRRTCDDAAKVAGFRTSYSTTGGGEKTSRVYELNEEVR